MNVIRHGMRWRAIRTRLTFVGVRHEARRRIVDRIVSLWGILGDGMDSGGSSGSWRWLRTRGPVT